MDNNYVNELVATQESDELAMYKAMYYKINAKPDSMTKAFSKKIVVNKDDLIDLNERIKDKLRLHYQDDGYIATVTVDLKDKKVLTFKCWEEFLQHNWVETSAIKGITMQWNFNIRVPGCEYPQMHNLVVKLTNGLRAEEMLNLIFSGNIEDFDEVELNAFPVVSRVDFIQTVLGEELINIVGNWVDGLSKNKDLKNPFLLFLRKYRKRVAQYFEYVSLIMLVVLGIGIESFFIKTLGINAVYELTITQANRIFIGLVIGLLIVYLARHLFEHIASWIYGSLEEYGKVFIFNITRGDKQIQDEVERKDKTNGGKIILNFVASIIFNVACGIIASLLA